MAPARYVEPQHSQALLLDGRSTGALEPLEPLAGQTHEKPSEYGRATRGSPEAQSFESFEPLEPLGTTGQKTSIPNKLRGQRTRGSKRDRARNERRAVHEERWIQHHDSLERVTEALDCHAAKLHEDHCIDQHCNARVIVDPRLTRFTSTAPRTTSVAPYFLIDLSVANRNPSVNGRLVRVPMSDRGSPLTTNAVPSSENEFTLKASLCP